MNSRRHLLVALAGMLVVPVDLMAQQNPTKMKRLGILGAETASGQASRVSALLAGLREQGYVEGKNIVIEYRWAEGKYEQLPGLASELVRLNVDVMVALGIKAALATKKITSTVPIVIPATADPLSTGLIASLARPGANVTGSAIFGSEMAAKQLELMREAMPKMTRVAMLSNPQNPANESAISALDAAAKLLKMSVRRFDVQSAADIDVVFAAMEKTRIGGAVVLADTLFVANAGKMVDLAVQKRIFLVGHATYAENGCVLGYGPNQNEMYRQVAVQIDKIFKGVKPSDIPVEQATRFELVVNLKTAKALRVTIPQSILVRATKVLE